MKKLLIPSMNEKSIPIGALRSLPEVMHELGFDAWELLESFGVRRADFATPLAPLSTAMHGRIIEAAIKLTKCEHLGLLLGQRASLDATGPLRFLVLNALTVRDAIDSLMRFCSLWYRGVHSKLSEDQGYSCITLSIEGNIPGGDQLLTAYLAAHVKILELILGHAWRPALVRIAYRKPKSAELYERFFRAPVWFGQSHHEVLFSQSLMDQPRASHDQKLDRFLRQHLSDMQAREPLDLSTQVRQVIETLLTRGECSVERVADFFAVHRFTLYRHLSEQGVNFEMLLEQTRRDIASQLLSQTDLQVVEVASRLGYENQGNFTRAFKRWHGQTPRDWRKQQAPKPFPAQE